MSDRPPAPDRRAVWTLTAIGYRESQVRSLWGDYCRITEPDDRCHVDFIQFAGSVQSGQSPPKVAMVPGADWRPSPQTVSRLERAGVSVSAINDYLPVWKLLAAERGEAVLNWDAAFSGAMLAVHEQSGKRVSVDDFTPAETAPSHPGWEPGIALALAEFRLYWRDRGGERRAPEEWQRLFTACLSQRMRG